MQLLINKEMHQTTGYKVPLGHPPESDPRSCVCYFLLNEACVVLSSSFILLLSLGNVGMFACLRF